MINIMYYGHFYKPRISVSYMCLYLTRVIMYYGHFYRPRISVSYMYLTRVRCGHFLKARSMLIRSTYN